MFQLLLPFMGAAAGAAKGATMLGTLGKIGAGIGKGASFLSRLNGGQQQQAPMDLSYTPIGRGQASIDPTTIQGFQPQTNYRRPFMGRMGGY